MCRKTSWILSATMVALGVPSLASAATLYSANFNSTTDISGWNINAAPTANAAGQGAITGFDYSTLGIPAAPGGSDTLGMRLRANVPGGDATPTFGGVRTAGATSGLSVSPTGQNFGSNYVVTFYAWSNFNGSANASGLADNANSAGGTNNVMFAVGTSGTVPLVAANTTLVTNGQMDGIGFATSGDGGITNDYRVYPKSGTIAATSTLTAGSYANTAAYYTSLLPAVSAPAIQTTTVYDGLNDHTQVGSTQPGSFGFAWHKVQMIMNGNVAYWTIDDNAIASLNVSSLGALGGNNLALGVSDVNGTTTSHPTLLFTVFDNLSVESVPEPSTVCLSLFGLAGLIGARRRA